VYRSPPDGYMDALVIYPKAVRETA
jgi:hypothetical protein